MNEKTMVCLISLLALDTRSIHPLILQLVSPQMQGLPNLCHSSAGFMLLQSRWTFYTILYQPDMQNSFSLGPYETRYRDLSHICNQVLKNKVTTLNACFEKALVQANKSDFHKTVGKNIVFKSSLFFVGFFNFILFFPGYESYRTRNRRMSYKPFKAEIQHGNSDNHQCEQCRQAPLTIHSIFQTCRGFLERAKNKPRNAAIYTYTQRYTYYCSKKEQVVLPAV